MYCSTNYSTKSLYINHAVRQVSLVEQNTIDYVSTAYFEPKKVLKKSNKYFYKRDSKQLFSADAIMLLNIF